MLPREAKRRHTGLFMRLKRRRSRGLMVSGGIYWKSGKLQPGHVNQAAVSAARQRAAEQRRAPARIKRGARSAASAAREKRGGLRYPVAQQHRAENTQTSPARN